MEVVLLQDIKGFGQKNDIKKVSDGYARNFLFPQGLAKPATEKSIEKIISQEDILEKNISELKDFLEDLRVKTKDAPLGINILTGGKGEVFGSIKSEAVQTALSEKYPETKKMGLNVILKKPLKEIGVHEIGVDAGRGIKDTFSIEVLPKEK
ncbi:50S ribosomal protein L9 [Patescibacteria group bacterium]|nr:50S ribosomal protein L9 [Patescibacteria group bacterium]